MNIHAVFFDLGGVILRTEYQAPREQLAERLNMTYEELAKIVFDSETSRLASLGKITVDQHWDAVVRRLGRPQSETAAIRAQFFAGDVLDGGLVAAIRSMRDRVHTGLISNGWPDVREYILRNHFEDAFESIVISAEVGVLKPQREIFQIALDRLGVSPTESAFVDDTRRNVEAARAIGMQGIEFRDPAQAEADLDSLLG